MRKLTYEEKPRLTLRKVKDGYSLTYISSSGRAWQGRGITPLSAWYALESLIKEFQINLQMHEYRQRLLPVSMKNGPDIGLGASDYVEPLKSQKWRWLHRIFRM